MGTHNFENVIYTDGDARTTYETLVDEALHECGHDPYNGTISTTAGVVEVRGVKPMTLAEAHTMIEQRLDNLSKWEACEALPLVDEKPAQWERLGNQEVTVTVTGAVFNDPTQLTAALAKALRVDPDQVDGYTTHDPKHPLTERTAVTPKVEAVAPKGKTETRFFIIDRTLRQMPDWEGGYATQAEARAALPDVLGRNFRSIPAREVEIVSVTRRATGEPLVTATVSAKKVEATFTVNLRRQMKAGTVGTSRAGWVFYGWAAC